MRWNAPQSRHRHLFNFGRWQLIFQFTSGLGGHCQLIPISMKEVALGPKDYHEATPVVPTST